MNCLWCILAAMQTLRVLLIYRLGTVHYLHTCTSVGLCWFLVCVANENFLHSVHTVVISFFFFTSVVYQSNNSVSYVPED